MPILDISVQYTQATEEHTHTVLHRSDVPVVVIGGNAYGKCDIPVLDGVVTYTHAVAGPSHTVMLRSDGTAVAFGGNAYGEGGITDMTVAET